MTTDTDRDLPARLSSLEQSVDYLYRMMDSLSRHQAPTWAEGIRTDLIESPLPRSSAPTPVDIRWPSPRITPTTRQDAATERTMMLGSLLTSVTHDLNNLLSIVSGFTEVLRDSYPDDDPRRETATTVMQMTYQAADLVRYLSEYAQGSAEVVEFPLNGLIERMSRLLPRYIGTEIQYTQYLGQDTGIIRINPTELLQIVLNLIGNAKNHTPAQGTISLRTAGHVLKDDRPGWPDRVPAGKYSLLAITDTGCGIKENVRMRMFENGFTTRGDAGGKGIGLSTVRWIVGQAGGYIQVQSIVDWGTTFRIFFPAL